MTIGNPAFCLAIHLTGVHFRGELQHVWWRQWANSQVLTNQNSSNRWCQVVRRTICLLAVWKFSCNRCANIFWYCYYSFCIVFASLYPFYSNAVSVCFNYFIFSITHSGFNQKIITHILDTVFITRSPIFLSEIHLKFVMQFLVLIFLIGRWSVGRCTWSVVGWTVVLRKPLQISMFNSQKKVGLLEMKMIKRNLDFCF